MPCKVAALIQTNYMLPQVTECHTNLRTYFPCCTYSVNQKQNYKNKNMEKKRTNTSHVSQLLRLAAESLKCNFMKHPVIKCSKR